MKVIKQVVGIDVALKELVVTLGRMQEDSSIDLYAYQVFTNNHAGFKSLLSWVKKLTIAQVPIQFVMEATGVYHQKFAYHLDENQWEVSIVLPNKISNYMRTLTPKTITDKTCSQAIAQFGLERKLAQWHRPKSTYRNLQQLSRERDQVVHERTMVKNQQHAELAEAEPNERSLERLAKRIIFLSAQEKEIKQDIINILTNDAVLKQEVENICTIPGVGIITAVIVLAETNGFELIRNKKQLTSYAGLDVQEKQSGTSVHGKPRISKKGNVSLRKSMHLPALTAVRCDENFKKRYTRLVAKHGIKMKALVAVQRKILELIYTLHKNKTPYDKDFTTEILAQKNSVQAQMA